MSKTYFNHTSKLGITKAGIVPACTIAISRDKNVFRYGVTICSKSDNFCKKTGREIAEDRMQKGFAEIEVPEVIKHLDDKQSCLQQLYNLTLSVVTKNKRWKGRITRFNEKWFSKEDKLSQIFESNVRIGDKYYGDNCTAKVVNIKAPFGEILSKETPTNRA